MICDISSNNISIVNKAIVKISFSRKIFVILQAHLMKLLKMILQPKDNIDLLNRIKIAIQEAIQKIIKLITPTHFFLTLAREKILAKDKNLK